MLLDLTMPDRDGLDLARAVRADPAYDALRLMMLTSATSLTADQLEEVDIAACLSKPTLASEIRVGAVGAPGRDRPSADARHSRPPADGRSRRGCSWSRTTRSTSWSPSGCSRRSATRRETADDGEVALVALAEGDFDAVLMDIQMPRMDGYATTRAIRAGETDDRLPVIAMTAAAVEGERERCLAAGMDDFLTKPVDPTALAAVLDQWISGSEAPAEPRSLPIVSDAAHSPVPGLELTRLDELRDLDPGNTAYLDRAIGNFVTNTPGTLATIRQALADGDAATLKSVSHKLAGGALNLGVTAAGRTAQQIELVADTGSVDGAVELVDQLDAALEDGRTALRAYQASYTSSSSD